MCIQLLNFFGVSVDLICDQMLIPGCEAVDEDSDLALLLQRASDSRRCDTSNDIQLLYCNRLIQGTGRCRLLFRTSPSPVVPAVAKKGVTQTGTLADGQTPIDALKRSRSRPSTSIDITLPNIAININYSVKLLNDLLLYLDKQLQMISKLLKPMHMIYKII